MHSQEIYLDSNATTSVLPQARAAALNAMSECFGNPSSVHASGLKARACIAEVRARARRLLGVPSGELVFTSGATEGIQTAVLSALQAVAGRSDVRCLLYGATEHKAVPEALRHWNQVLGLGLEVLAIPVATDGRHDLAWLREHARHAGLVCTMAANNESGVISDLAGISTALQQSPALWLVDGVQALGKLTLNLVQLGVDYAVFSGHKLYAPKGIGLLYVCEGAPLTPLLAGGGQEGALRSGTENVPAIAALGAVFEALEDTDSFRDVTTLKVFRDRLATALCDAFPGLMFNAPAKWCLPTTLNFSVPDVDAKLLLDAFDAVGLRMSGGSACSATSQQDSHVLRAMGLPAWQINSAVRLSFGPADDITLIDEACRRIRLCGSSLKQHGLLPSSPVKLRPEGGLVRLTANGACCYLLLDAESRRCVVIDPLPELTATLAQWMRCRDAVLIAVLDTHSHGDHVSSSGALWQATGARPADPGALDALGWPLAQDSLILGRQRLSRLALPGHTQDAVAYLWYSESDVLLGAFVGDTIMPGALGRSDFEQSAPLEYCDSLRRLRQFVGSNTLLMPGHDYEDRLACTFESELAAQPLLKRALHEQVDPVAFAAEKAQLESGLALTKHHTIVCGAQVSNACAPMQNGVEASQLKKLVQRHSTLIVVDVRESHEQQLCKLPSLGPQTRMQSVPLTRLLNALPSWLGAAHDQALLLVCRSGNRSGAVARALAQLGHPNCYSLIGGLALWPSVADQKTKVTSPSLLV